MKRSRIDKLVLATNNAHKVQEIKAILRKSGVRIRILTLDDFPKAKPVVENKSTIEGNARKKAIEVARRTGCWALSDDTGLFIKALRGRPGVYSARFAGPQCSFEDNIAKVLRLMKRVPRAKRHANFRTVAALASPKGKTYSVQGKVIGRIPLEKSGGKGFGYDPVFWVPSLKKTYAEMSASAKNTVSHRARTFLKMGKLLKSFQ